MFEENNNINNEKGDDEIKAIFTNEELVSILLKEKNHTGSGGLTSISENLRWFPCGLSLYRKLKS